MCEEAYDEIELESDDGRTLVVRGGYCRDKVYVGICRSKDDLPNDIIAVDGKELKRALRSMHIGRPRQKARARV